MKGVGNQQSENRGAIRFPILNFVIWQARPLLRSRYGIFICLLFSPLLNP